VIGAANLTADGLSMAVGNYLSIRSNEAARRAGGLPEEESQPVRHALATFSAFAGAGVLPLLPYLVPLTDTTRFRASVGLTLIGPPVPTQAPAEQVSVAVQLLPSSHVVPLGRNWLAGQVSATPLHFSATSQLPLAARHSVSTSAGGLAGQLGPVPVHTAFFSQVPGVALAQTAVEKPLAGQAATVPLHFSATSHGPAAGRQTVVALAGGAWQALLTPVQCPSARHVLGCAALHTVEGGL
jgi:hypothetical protein